MTYICKIKQEACACALKLVSCKENTKSSPSTAKSTIILSNFIVWKFCGKAQFSSSFRRFARNYAETVSLYIIFAPGNKVKLRYFLPSLIHPSLLSNPWKFRRFFMELVRYLHNSQKLKKTIDCIHNYSLLKMMACGEVTATNNTVVVLVSYSEWFLFNGLVNIEKKNNMNRAMSFLITYNNNLF